MLKNFLFSFIFFSGIILISIIFLPALILPQTVILFGGKLMGHWAGLCLKVILSTKIEIIGKENILKNEKFFIASSHQSMFETFYLQTIFNSPVFILKKELLSIPIFGWYLKKIGSISIQRSKVTKENLNFFSDIHKISKNSNRPVVIFPQGTRVNPNEFPPFKKGVSRIYEELKISCQPIVINSGNVWPKNGPKQSNKKITISILTPINYEETQNEFIKNLEEKIYDELKKLN